jgi:hypothetical protein
MARLCGHGQASMVMGMVSIMGHGYGHACHGWLAMGVGHGVSVWVVGVPWLWQGEGASGVPIQRNLLNVYPNLELTKHKRSSFPNLE